MRYQPRLVTALPSSVATAAMILCGVSLHQVSPLDDGFCTASIMVVKKFGDCTMSAPSPRLFRNALKCALRLRPVDAVDRRGVIARDDQQPLDAGEPRLLVVIFGILGEIGDEVAVVGPRRRDLGERRGRLVAAALAGGGDDEIVRRDAQRVAAVLRDRRGAVDAERARVQQDAVGGQRALQHHAAGGGIDPEPAARGGRGFFVDADRGLDHIAHAVAEFQIGERGQGGHEQRDRRGGQRHQEAVNAERRRRVLSTRHARA